MENNNLLVKLDKKGNVIGLKGKCKAKDFPKQIKLLKSLGGQNEK